MCDDDLEDCMRNQLIVNGIAIYGLMNIENKLR